MIQEGFTFYRPHEALREYVRFYWVFRSDLAASALTFPTGCPQIIFHKRKPLYIPELDTFQSRLTISGQVNFPFLIWGKYRSHWFRKTLTVSFQFHHTQMDGAHAAIFLSNLQTEIGCLKI